MNPSYFLLAIQQVIHKIDLFINSQILGQINELLSKIRTAIGVSANVFTTIGPLSFTFAQDITKATNDETETFNFRLGTSF